jgi:hypothetical protein
MDINELKKNKGMVRERERERGAGGRSKEMKKSTVYL